MLYEGLKRGGVFLVHCEVNEETIKVGMMYTQPPHRGKTVRVFDAIGSDPDSFWVKIPENITILQIGAELERVTPMEDRKTS